ncbi:MAG TPA: hypothetical protein VNG12_20125 [Acidimicrobiales bacterium]|nr:hypothetical protein [Acidimicrobiales bacterium]
MNPDHWEMEFFQADDGSEPAKQFIEDLDTPKKFAIQVSVANLRSPLFNPAPHRWNHKPSPA